MKDARTSHEIFETEFHKREMMRWRDWWLKQWESHIDFYERIGWRMIPIIFRGKLPLRSNYNYESQGAKGPYVNVTDALIWIANRFNLAVVAEPSGIMWIDVDSTDLYKPEFLKGLVMRTPRGFAIPLTLPGRDKDLDRLKKLGYDMREGIAYELVPLSETCMNDHDLKGKRHTGPRDLCNDNLPHNYKIREWVTPLTNTPLTCREFCEMVL